MVNRAKRAGARNTKCFFLLPLLVFARFRVKNRKKAGEVCPLPPAQKDRSRPPNVGNQMSQPAESLRPYGNAPPPERPAGGSPHLSDYWQVVSRRLWLVLLVFGVTTAAAIWAVSRQRVYYQAHLALQVNDPAQTARSLVAPGRVSGIDIFVDPIESEIQVLRSTPIAAAVVDSLGLRLKPASADQARPDLFRD